VADDNTIPYLLDSVLPDYLTYTFINDSYLQTMEVNFEKDYSSLNGSNYLTH